MMESITTMIEVHHRQWWGYIIDIIDKWTNTHHRSEQPSSLQWSSTSLAIIAQWLVLIMATGCRVIMANDGLNHYQVILWWIHHCNDRPLIFVHHCYLAKMEVVQCDDGGTSLNSDEVQSLERKNSDEGQSLRRWRSINVMMEVISVVMDPSQLWWSCISKRCLIIALITLHHRIEQPQSLKRLWSDWTSSLFNDVPPSSHWTTSIFAMMTMMYNDWGSIIYNRWMTDSINTPIDGCVHCTSFIPYTPNTTCQWVP